MTKNNDATRALELYQKPRYMVRYDKMRDDHRYEVFRYGEDDDEPEIVIYSRYEHEGDADHAQDEANLDDIRTALLKSAQVDGLVTLLTEIRKWMDKDMGAWDVKFMAEIDKALQQFSATEI